MKYHWILLACLALAFTACAAIHGGSGLPKQRPADLVINYHNGGGMLDQGEDYLICQDSCVRDSRFQGHQNRWICKTDPKKLDALYAQFIKDDVTSIQSENQGEVYDRGGVTLRFSHGGKSTELIDAGSNFIVENDRARFARTSAGIVAFVEQGLQSQAIPVVIDLRVETGDTAVQACSVSLDNQQILNWQVQNAVPLAQVRTVQLLPGRYEVQGSAQVGQKWVSLHWPITMSAQKDHFLLLLKNGSFGLQEK
jgi:hypothetical protein